MEIGGLQKLTLIDYPKKLACTVFTTGCNFRCPFCYASELVLPEKIKNQPKIAQSVFFNFLKEKKGLIEGVVICGGEPTIHKDLPSFIKKIKKMNYSVKLDTNGSNPAVLKKLIENNFIDYVAMDIKGPKESYQKLTVRKINVANVERSVKILKESKIDFEFRTTIVPEILEKKDITQIARWIGPGGKYYLQGFRPEKTVDPRFEKVKPYPGEYMVEIKNAVAPLFDVCEIRGI
ncbi:MAG: anaerobic ribonucleoside-triphosphate reductase activating protein [Candidatus Nealsonbacteria bacterium]|nr:anaerobic ribonucleoside-triphosphate reductase activating protein [Candidatus Nealsonbacteria bacterium]